MKTAHREIFCCKRSFSKRPFSSYHPSVLQWVTVFCKRTVMGNRTQSGSFPGQKTAFLGRTRSLPRNVNFL